MDQFEKAKLKALKKQEQNRAYKASIEAVAKKEEPKVAVKKAPLMVVTISGPADLKFEVDYAGTLISSQASPEALTALFKKQLSVFGRVV